MEIPVKVLKDMDIMGLSDRRVVRIPREFRTSHNIDIGDTLHLKGNDGGVVPLKVEPITEDNGIDKQSVYVSTLIFNLLKVANIEDNTIEFVGDITLGCDPELFLVDYENGTVVSAARFFNKNDQIGFDGLMLELRPDPSVSELDVVENLKNLMNGARRKINNSWGEYSGSRIRMLAASHYDGLSAGFHLHYGLPKELLQSNREATMFAYRLTRIMDYYIGIPSIIPEGNDSVRRSAPYTTYGKPGQHRLDFRTLEYRVPGGYLLRHPKLTAGILGLGAVVTEDIVSRCKKVTNNFKDLSVLYSDDDLKGLYPSLPKIEDIFKSICNINVDESLTHVDRIYSDVKKMLGYNRRKESIDGFFDAIMNNEKFDAYIELNWRV